MYSRQVSSFREKLNSRILRPAGVRGQGSRATWGPMQPPSTLRTPPARGQRVLCIVGVLLGHPERWEQRVPTPLAPWGRTAGVWGAHPWARTQGHDLHTPPGTPGGV